MNVEKVLLVRGHIGIDPLEAAALRRELFKALPDGKQPPLIGALLDTLYEIECMEVELRTK